MWSKKKTAESTKLNAASLVTEESLNQDLLNNLHSFIVKYRSIGNNGTANQLVDIYTLFNKQFPVVKQCVSESKDTPANIPESTATNANTST